MKSRFRWLPRWQPVDAVVAAYTLWTGALIAWFAPPSQTATLLLGVHLAILTLLLIIPARRTGWEARRPSRRGPAMMHGFVRFLRHAYPLPLALFFFEEGAFTVNMIFPEEPFWFEPRLYAADTTLFSDLPARLLAAWVTPATTELMNIFYASYYVILVGGVGVAYVGGGGAARRRATPAPGFDEVILSLTVAFVAAFALYPWVAARGPWENVALVAGLPPLDGFAVTALMDRIIAHGAVSGNCFPSGHIAGAWAVVFGLAWTPANRPVALAAALVAAGMSVACVYTRYHHAVDVPAGLACAVVGAAVVGALRLRRGATRLP